MDRRGVLGGRDLPFVQPRFREWIANPDLADPAAFASMFLVALIVLSIVANIVGGVVRESLLGGIDRTLGVVFGLVRGAALVVFAYIIAGMVVETDRWPDPVLQASSLPFAYQGAVWATGLLPEGYRPTHLSAAGRARDPRGRSSACEPAGPSNRSAVTGGGR